MNKSRLTRQLAETMHISVREAATIVNSLLSAMADALAQGQSIEIRGFGSFIVKHYDSYIGRNPKTGQLITVKPKKLPFFKAGKHLREQVNQQRNKQGNEKP